MITERQAELTNMVLISLFIFIKDLSFFKYIKNSETCSIEIILTGIRGVGVYIYRKNPFFTDFDWKLKL